MKRLQLPVLESHSLLQVHMKIKEELSLKTFIFILVFSSLSHASEYDVKRIIDGNPKIIKDFEILKRLRPKNQVSIAVIGDYIHPEQFKTIAINELEIPNNGIDDDQNGHIDDYFGMDFDVSHGRVSAPARSGHENGIVSIMDGIISHYGLDQDIKIIPINIVIRKMQFDDLFMKKMADSIDYAITRGAKVISISQGISMLYNHHYKFIDNDVKKSFKYVEDAFDRAIRSGIIIVGAVSNNNQRDHVLEPEYPANREKVIGVANVNFKGVIQSGYGKNTDLAYYGTDIYVWAGIKGGYELTKGSSLATPLVAVSIAAAMTIDDQIRTDAKFLNNMVISCSKSIKSLKNISSKCIYSPSKFISKYLK